MKARYAFSIIATIAVLIIAVAYLSMGVLKMQVFSDQTTVTITAPKSNGLHAGSAVLLRGVSIGSVTSVSYTGSNDIEIQIAYDASHRIPSNSKLVIENQSMIGESGLFLIPPSDGQAEPIRGGQALTASVVEVPASVPELLGSTQTLLDQVDPTLVNDLVDTLATALAGTEGDVERLTPAAQVLAATMIYSQPAIKKVIGNATTMLQDGAWIGPSLRPTAPQLVYAGTSIRDVVTAVKPFATYTDGGVKIRERWKPSLNRSAVLVNKIAPPLGSIADTLLPTARQSGSVLSQIDFATLLQQAMTVLPGDSVALNLGPPR
ncbi:MlaD family protein [Gordonia aichiensis]